MLPLKCSSATTTLIVSQDWALADLLLLELHRGGIQSVRVQGDEHARTVLRQHCPDIVILDSNLPESVQFLSDLRSSNTPVIVIGLVHSDEMRRKFEALGVEAIVSEDLGLMPILNAVQSYMDTGSEPPIEQSTEAKIEVLIVDDQEDILELVSYDLRSWGYSVLTARDGDEALEIAKQHPQLAAVLLDILMPGRSGIQILKEFHDRTPSLGVIIMSSLRDREIARHTIESGAFDYITKPPDITALEGAVRACVSHTAYQRQPWWKRLASSAMATR